jgi:hypothetical protein
MNGYVIRDPHGKTLAVLGDDDHLVEKWLQRHTPFSYREALTQGFTVERIMP